MSAIDDLREAVRYKISVDDGLRLLLRGLARHISGYGAGRPPEDEAVTRADLMALASDLDNGVEGIVAAVKEHTPLDATMIQPAELVRQTEARVRAELTGDIAAAEARGEARGRAAAAIVPAALGG